MNMAKKESRDRARLLAYKVVPQWPRDNEYVLSGYRRTSESIQSNLHTLVTVNNETINIHSRLLGALFLAVLPYIEDIFQGKPLLLLESQT